jgi:hypothetical protein
MDEEVYKTIATALRTGVRGDIWDGQQNGPDFAVLNTQRAVLIAATQAAMEAAADILHIEEPEDDDPVQAYLKRMAERGDDEAKSLLA